jgi:16S rRNA (cytidine1402-2'-O)-methyltransferase
VVLTALVLAGLPTDRFLFEGFLPARGAARRARLLELAPLDATLVLFESPRRLLETLDDVAALLPSRPVVVARELTKLHEEVRRGTAAELAAACRAGEAPRGEIVLLIGAEPDGAAGEPPADTGARLEALLATLSLKEAVAQVAAETGLPRRQVYARALALTRGEPGP